jgi:TolB protein
MAGAPPQIAFERGNAIWIASTDGSNARKIIKGSAPDLSPDGMRIAFHSDESTAKDLVRQIAVVDVATKKVTVFRKEIPSQNCQRAIWSPDGKHILFSIWADNDWHLAMINADGSAFHYVKKPERKYNSYWSTCWTPDGRSFYAQDLDKIYQFTTDGKELKSWTVNSLFSNGSMNSGSSIAVSPDGKTLLVEVDMDEEPFLPDWEGPPPSLWTLDLASEKTTRLTPRGVLCWHGCWLDNKEILFGSQSATEKTPTIYKMRLAEKDRQAVLKNANNPSVSRSPSL